MGIHGLMKLISEEAPGALKEKTMDNLNDRKVAIDASMAIYQFMIAVRSAGGPGGQAAAMLTNEAGEVTSHIQGMFNRTIKMMESGVRPAYVFDGKPPQLKGGELAKRLAKREKAETDLAAAKEAGEVEDIERFSKRLVKVTRQHNEDCKELLRLMGVPYVTAPCEAEAQCAELAKKGKVFATATEDMDSLTFRTPKLLRRFTFSQGKDKLPIIEIDTAAVLEGLQLTYDEFVDLCILCGCDYCNTIKGIGPKTALKLIRQYHTLENVVKALRRERKYEIPDDWKTQKVPKIKPDDTAAATATAAAAAAAAETPAEGATVDQENKPENSNSSNTSAATESASSEEVVKPAAVNADATATATAAADDATATTTAATAGPEEDEDTDAPEAKADLEADVDLDAGADLLTADICVITAEADEEAAVTLAEGEDEEFEIIPPLYAQARRLFLQAEVTPGDDVDLKWEEPKEEELKKYLIDRMGFNAERVQNGINKLQAAFRKKSQKRMDSFFTSLGTVQSSTSLNNKRKAEEAAKHGGGKKGKAAPAAKKGGSGAFAKKR